SSLTVSGSSAAGSGARSRYCTSQCSRHVPKPASRPCRCTTAGPAPTCCRPPIPISSATSRRAARAQLASPGSSGPRGCTQQRTLRCHTSATWSPGRSITIALAVRWRGPPSRCRARGFARSSSRYCRARAGPETAASARSSSASAVAGAAGAADPAPAGSAPGIPVVPAVLGAVQAALLVLARGLLLAVAGEQLLQLGIEVLGKCDVRQVLGLLIGCRGLRRLRTAGEDLRCGQQVRVIPLRLAAGLAL